ncbi:hypothetical protein LTR85_009294 [Meristemomyces frigidus]|nr:hypothetical protein LTR85_009294 [Meristemomyces frigidus]
MAPTNIAVIGSLMVDHIVITNRLPDRGETYPANSYHKALGGKGVNAAISAYRSCHNKPLEAEEASGAVEENELNINVRMIGAVGNDEYTTVFKEALESNRIDTTGIRTVDGKATAMTFIMVEEDSRNNRILSVAGATQALSPDDFTKVEDLGNGIRPDLVISQLEISTKAVEQILDTAGRAEIDVLLNAAPANNILSEKYRFITHLLVNETEAAILSGLDLDDLKEENWSDIAQGFLSEGVKNVVITLGEAGAFYANARASWHVPAFKIVPVDPTGAGQVTIWKILILD